MEYFSEFCGSLIFLLGGFAYMCNISLKKTLVGTLNYTLPDAWYFSGIPLRQLQKEVREVSLQHIRLISILHLTLSRRFWQHSSSYFWY